MVAYSFQPRFVEPILAGTKRQTIRADRRRHARAGEPLQLYTGMRTKQCRLIGRTVCERAAAIAIDLRARTVAVDGVLVVVTTGDDPDGFARSDGFADWPDFATFFRLAHPGADVFEGVVIRWREFTQP